MPYCVFDKTTGLFLSGTMHIPVVIDPTTQVQVTLDAYPDPRTQRLDPSTGTLRDATPGEILAFDRSQVSPLAQALDAILQAPVPTTTQLKAVFQLLRQRIT